MRSMHVLIRPRLLPYTLIVPAKLQDLRPSPSFTKSSIDKGPIAEQPMTPRELSFSCGSCDRQRSLASFLHKWRSFCTSVLGFICLEKH